MSSKIDGVPRDLIEWIFGCTVRSFFLERHDKLKELRTLLAAPVVKRQPVQYPTLASLLADLPDGYSKDDVAFGWNECVDNTSPPTIDPTEALAIARLTADLDSERHDQNLRIEAQDYAEVLQTRLVIAEQQNAELVELLTEALPHLNIAASAFKAMKPVRDKVRATIKPAILATPSSWPCWSCKDPVTMAQRGDADGDCPHCGAELDIESWPFTDAAAPVVERQPVVIDFDAMDFETIQKAADESSWMPNEYMRNEWVADVCNFLKCGRADTSQPAPVAVVLTEVRALLATTNYSASRDCHNAQVVGAACDLIDKAKGLNP